MSKIYVPSNVKLSGNARRNIQQIETNNNYDPLVSQIQEFLDFVSKCPTNTYEARQRGWQIEKLSKSKGSKVYSIRLTDGDRFTYEVRNGQVTVLGILGHYKGTTFASQKFDNFDSLLDETASFYYGLTSFEELLENCNGLNVVPDLEDKDDKYELLSLKERINNKSLLPSDIKSIEFIKDEEHLYFQKEDLMKLYEKQLKKENRAR